MHLAANPETYCHLTVRKPRTKRVATPTTTMLTVDQFAEEVQASRRSVERWISEGRLKTLRAGHGIRIHRNAINAFLQQRPRKPYRRPL